MHVYTCYTPIQVQSACCEDVYTVLLIVYSIDRITALHDGCSGYRPRQMHGRVLLDQRLAMPIKKKSVWPRNELATALEADAEVRELLGAAQKYFLLG